MRETPMMTEVEIIEMNYLLGDRRPTRVLEWGSGGSTIYWPPRHDCIRAWISVEHDEAWADKVTPLLDPKVHLLLISFPGYWDYLRHSGPFDLILVDGRHRVECMEVASRIVTPEGIVLLHDSARVRYQPAWEFFAHSRTLTEGMEAGQGLTMFWGAPPCGGG